jgi:hypothetical protein
MKNIAVFVVAAVFLILLMGIFYFIPEEAVWVALVALLLILAFNFLSRLIRGKKYRESSPRPWDNLTSLLVILTVIFIIFVATLWDIRPSALIQILLISLVFTLMVNFLTVPLAIFHKMRQSREVFQPSTYKPRVSIIVPAFNEEKVIARTLVALIEAE